MPRSTQHSAPFPATAWTRLLTAQDLQAPEARLAREEVCRIYWPPVYSYFRALGCEREVALDLTHELLANFCDGGRLGRVTPEEGSLRPYLKTSARHRLINLRRDVSAKKRGGGTLCFRWRKWILLITSPAVPHHQREIPACRRLDSLYSRVLTP